MEWTPEIDELVDKYFADHLTGEEQMEWEALMKVPQFRWHVKQLAEERGLAKVAREIVKEDRTSKWKKSRLSNRWFRFSIFVVIFWLVMILYFILFL
jgi:hypothetical protein